jgi:hypothetical protein
MQGREGAIVHRATERAERAKSASSASVENVDAIPPLGWLLLAMAFLGAALIVYEPAMNGMFLSDDGHYIQRNVYIHELSLENFVAILEPLGPVTLAVVNYSPAQMLIHALAWNSFGSDTTGHHVVNIVFHALASLLLIPLFLRTGIPRAAAILGATFFLLHPANVEAVAWISQLKSSSSLAFSLAALLLFPKRPSLGTAFFVLALLAKPTAAVVLPVAALLAWTQREKVAKPWWLAWVVIFALFAIVEFTVHQRSGAAEATLYDTPFDLVMTVFGLAMRYLVMGATSLGVSTFHEPEPIRSLLDLWWLFSLPVLAALAWRLVVVWRRRQPEVAYWVWALVSFGPISQIFPFLYPLADRYLYFILPGLIGGALLMLGEGFGRLVPGGDRRRTFELGAMVAGLVLCSAMAAHSHQRAGIWRYSATVIADAARHYPDGVSANLIRANRAGSAGDADAAAEALRAAAARGFNRFEMIYNESRFDPVRRHPKFKAVVDEMALVWIEKVAARESPTQSEVRMAAHAHIARGEYGEARRMLHRALEQGGAHDAQIRDDLQQLSTIAD